MMDGKLLAFSGKGGSGKTTLSAMVLRELLRKGQKPILAVDADPNATLGLALGVEPTRTIADLRDDMGEAAQKPTEIPKDRLMDQWLAEILSENEGFDLLTMGRPEGPKCYCYVNGLLRRYLSLLRKSYRWIIVDCEAGMEYLSRLTVDDVETLVLVAESSPVGLTTANRISLLADSLHVRINRRILGLNKVGRTNGEEQTNEFLSNLPNVQEVFRVPYDEDLADRCAKGAPIDNGAGALAKPVVQEIVECISGH